MEEEKSGFQLHIESIKEEYTTLYYTYISIQYGRDRVEDKLMISDRMLSIILFLGKHKEISEKNYKEFMLSEGPINLNFKE